MAERMALSGVAQVGASPEFEEESAPSLRRRMVDSGWLFGMAGIVSFIGFLMVAFGLAENIPVLGANFGGGWAYLSGLVPWGVGIIGLGVMLGFFGAAVKGPSVEWREIAPEKETFGPAPSPGIRFACPACGGDVYSTQAACPECGSRLPRPRTAGS